MERKSFKTLTKSNVVIVKQPVIYVEKDSKGKVKSRRQIQYIETHDEVFVDLQIKVDPKAKKTPIYFNKGILTVPEDNITLIKFLSMHPDNKANGGNKFKLIEVEKEQMYQINEFEKLDEARELLMNAKETEARSLALWFLGSSFANTKITINKIKLTLRQKLESDKDFVDKLSSFMKDKNNNEKLMVTVALSEGIIKVHEGRKIIWGDGGEVIFISAQSKDVIQDFATFVKTDEEGRQYLKVIADKIAKLPKKPKK